MPLWTLARRTVARSLLAAALWRRGALATGVVVGMVLSLTVGALGVAAGLDRLWQVGFFWSWQWWWSLVPEAAQPWLFAIVRGAAYGAAAWAFGLLRVRTTPPCARKEWDVLPALRSLVISTSPAVWTGGAALVVSLADTEFATQYSLIAAALGAAVGRVTEWVMRGSWH